MSNASFEQIKAILRSLSNTLRSNIAEALGVAQAAKSTAENAAADVESALEGKMSSTDPVGTGSFSMNRKTDTEIGPYSHTEGYRTTASGWYSHAEGAETTASGGGSHAEGRSTTASGNYSHAEGSFTTASGSYSHAEGAGGTTASGDGSHAEGYHTTASGDYSHAEGEGTKASSQHQHVQGRYNRYSSGDNYAHVVGNGTTAARSNAHTLDWDGNAWFAGTVEGTALILPSPDGSRWQITVDDTGALSATRL